MSDGDPSGAREVEEVCACALLAAATHRLALAGEPVTTPAVLTGAIDALRRVMVEVD